MKQWGQLVDDDVLRIYANDERPDANQKPHLTFFVGGLFIAIVLPELGLLSTVSPGHDAAARFGRQVVWLMIGLALLFWVRWAERLPLTSIGLRRPTLGTVGWGFAGAVALIASFVLCYPLILPLLGLRIARRDGIGFDLDEWSYIPPFGKGIDTSPFGVRSSRAKDGDMRPKKTKIAHDTTRIKLKRAQHRDVGTPAMNGRSVRATRAAAQELPAAIAVSRSLSTSPRYRGFFERYPTICLPIHRALLSSLSMEILDE